MTHLRPAAHQLEALLALPPDRPVTLLNLLRFHPDGGAERYAEYLRQAGAHVAAIGGRVVFDGEVLLHLVDPEEGPRWDRMLLVRYPSVRAFLSMIQDSEFRSLTPIREGALAAFRLIVLAGGKEAG